MIYLIISLLFFQFTLAFGEQIWVDMSDDPNSFDESVWQNEGLSIGQSTLKSLESRSIEHSRLLSKTEYWSKKSLGASLLDTELKELERNFVFNQINRLVLFEYLKKASDNSSLIFKHLCQLYANDSFLKTENPFFESSCSLERQSLKDLNSNLAKFDFFLVDGNRVDIHTSPYFFSSGATHQFVFVSNKYSTFEISSTAEDLRKANVTLQPWIDGTCDAISNNRVPSKAAIKVHFSKECTTEIHGNSNFSENFFIRNRYYIIAGLVSVLLISSLQSQYELGVTWP